MGQVTVTVYGQSYKLACKDGEEARLEALASYVDAKVNTLQQSLGSVGESRLFLMSALLLADELMEARDGGRGGIDNAALASATDAVNSAAAEIEHIAAKLENA